MALKKPILTYLNEHFPFGSLLGEAEGDTPQGKSAFNRYKVSKLKHYLVIALRIGPWICGGGLLIVTSLKLFALSYFFGLQMTDTFQLFGGTFSYQQLYELVKNVTVGGLIGFGTNWLAIRMLFRPLKKRPIWGQGMIPAQRDIIIDTLAGGIHKHILSQRLIRQRIEESGLVKRLNDILIEGSVGVLQDQALRGEIKDYLNNNLQEYFDREEVRNSLRLIIDEQVEKKVEKGLKKLVLTTYKRFNREDYDALIDEIIKDIPASSMDIIARLEDEIETAVSFIQKQQRATEVFMMRFIIGVLNRIDVKSLLVRQMAHFNEERLEKMVWEATNEQLLYIQYLGTVLGVLGGLIIWSDYTIVVYILLFGVLMGIDTILYRIRNKKELETKGD